jgi:serine/threonine-protein kinase ULK/ATG1
MDVAGAWWGRKNRASAEATLAEHNPQPSPKSKAVPMTGAAAVRMNKVVQWVRDRFNEVLEKAEFVRLKLVAAQRRLPASHPSHPANHPQLAAGAAGSAAGASSGAASGPAGVSDDVFVTPGVSAEKLMYTRALEMGKSAAVNELVCEDLGGCEIAYVTAIRMLEAVLDEDDEALQRKLPAERGGSSAPGAREADAGSDAALARAGDREHIMKGTFHPISRSRAGLT